MYSYDFENESIICERHNVFAEIKEKELFVNVLVTDKNLLIFYNIENDIVTLKSRGVFVAPNYELLIKFDLKSIRYSCEDNNTYINDDVVLYDFVLKEDD
ncbi:MAG: hypothetical protein IJN13_00600 [Bacilli bacterium]|nr:hypothetical protein [Bacilli bacterium]